MKDLEYYLKELAVVYHSSMKKVRNIEDKAAISSLNHKFVNNLRHFIEHMFVGIEKAYLEPPDKESAIDHFKQALHDVKNIALDSAENIAGLKLNEAKKHIMGGIVLSERRKAQEYFRQAVYHYDEGRNKRTIDPDEANEHFAKSVDLCVEGMLSVKPITTRQWITWLLMFLSLLAGLSGWGMFLAKIFKFF